MAQQFPNTNRSIRVAEQIHRILADILIRDMRDEKLQLVSIVAVNLSADLSVARVYVTSLNDENKRDEMINALNHAAGYMRLRLSQLLSIRRTPNLTFTYDHSIEYGSKMSALIDDAIGK